MKYKDEWRNAIARRLQDARIAVDDDGPIPANRPNRFYDYWVIKPDSFDDHSSREYYIGRTVANIIKVLGEHNARHVWLDVDVYEPGQIETALKVKGQPTDRYRVQIFWFF